MFDRAVNRPIRVLIAKPGLDGHDRGAKVVARALRDAGMEVIYTGIRQTPEQILDVVIQEDVDVLGISILSGAHDTLIPRLMTLLKENKVEDILIIAGGIIPKEDVLALKEAGIAEVFGPGTRSTEVVTFIKNYVKTNRHAPRG